MNVQAFRITKTRFVSVAFDGEGARLHGGRWNSMGTRMVYLSDSLSGATLELLVHTEHYATITGHYSFLAVTIARELIESVDAQALPDGWDSPIPIAATQLLGDRWIASMSSVALRVPSALSSGEFNYLLNPAHGDFSRLAIAEARKFRLDPRI